MKWLKRMFCFHLNWTETPDWGSGQIIPAPDWRLNTRYWRCVRCSKLKCFGYSEIPIQYVR